MPKVCTKAEWRILECLWEQGGMSAQQITQALMLEAGWSQQAVELLLKRMLQKDLIALEESGSEERYVSGTTREQVVIGRAPVTMSLLERLQNRLAKGGTHQ